MKIFPTPKKRIKIKHCVSIIISEILLWPKNVIFCYGRKMLYSVFPPPLKKNKLQKRKIEWWIWISIVFVNLTNFFFTFYVSISILDFVNWPNIWNMVTYRMKFYRKHFNMLHMFWIQLVWMKQGMFFCIQIHTFPFSISI